MNIVLLLFSANWADRAVLKNSAILLKYPYPMYFFSYFHEQKNAKLMFLYFVASALFFFLYTYTF